MGCVSSSFLNEEDAALGHHIVRLTSTTYGLLTLDPPISSTTTFTRPAKEEEEEEEEKEEEEEEEEEEVINSWELMAGLDSNDSFRFPISTAFALSSQENWKAVTPTPTSTQEQQGKVLVDDKENWHPNMTLNVVDYDGFAKVSIPKEYNYKCCESEWDNKVVLYTTTLGGVRPTFEACNVVRSALLSLGFSFCERDISMDCRFRHQFNSLSRQLKLNPWLPPRLFIRGRYIGGADQVLRFHDHGTLLLLLQGLPKRKPGPLLCDGCGGFRFLPCFRCHGSCKLLFPHTHPQPFNSFITKQHHPTIANSVVIRCPDCNENGLVLCPICT